MSYGLDGFAGRFSPPRYTDTPLPSASQAATFAGGRSVQRREASGCPDPALFVVAGQQAADALLQSPWFERDMPAPVQDIKDSLQPDCDTWETLQDPVRSEAFYREQIAGRRQVEARGEEYIFAPLQVTLENMRRLTLHILADRQFPQPLTQEEGAAFRKLLAHIEGLIRRDAPYKRTVQLAFVMCALQELMVERHVIVPLRAAKPRLFDRERCEMAGFFCQGTNGSEQRRVAAAIPLQEVFACRWGYLVLDGGQRRQDSLLGDRLRSGDLLRCLDNRAVLLYPSFASLELEHFCRFGHLPVYPLGMMTQQAINADGRMRTPLAFMEHDILHMVINETWRHLDGSGPLEAVACRLRFRQLALDRLPVGLQEQKIERAVILVLFQLFHEKDVNYGKCIMTDSTPLCLWDIICEARREHRYSYGPDYRAIGDGQALLACLWVFRVYQCLNLSAGRSLARCEVQAAEAMTLGLPAFLEHWAFFDKHRDRLHERLLPGCRFCAHESQYLYPVQGKLAWAFTKGEVLLQMEKDPDAEGTVRNTDLVYFVTLLSEGGPAFMARTLGEAPPDARRLRPLFEV